MKEPSVAASWRILALTGLCLAVAAPHIWSGLFWYPAGVKDSLLYIFGASRFLTSGSLLGRAVDPRAWTYSAYPLLLATVSRIEGQHPMAAYPTLGFATALLLPGAMGLFVHHLTGRSRSGILGYFIASLWGGLAGYLFLVSGGLPALLAGGAPLMNSDYFEPRFLGEYAGPHSELTAYLCQLPSYPRTAGLVLFWPALAVIYKGLPYPSGRRLLLFSVVLLLTTAVYPYYGVSGLLVLVVVGFLRFRGAGRSVGTYLLALVILTGVLGLADFCVWSQSQGLHLPQYLAFLWGRPLKPESWLPSLRFDPWRTLSGHFFMLVAVVWAAALPESGLRPSWNALTATIRMSHTWAGWPLAWASIIACFAGGILSTLSVRARMMLNAYGWIVPWRTLVEPLVVLCAATALERLVARPAGARTRALVVALIALPCLSPLHWALNSALFFRAHHRNRELYQTYLSAGDRLLGRVALREPLFLEGSVGETLYVQAALGTRTVPKSDDAVAPLFEPEHRETLLALMRGGSVGDLAVVRGGTFSRNLMASAPFQVVASFDRYDIVRAAAVP